MNDKLILLLKLNEQLNDFRKAMDKFAESCTKIVEKYGLSSDETECEQPDADTISRQQGRWEMLQIPINPPVYKCAVCGGHTQDLTNFCPNCGADMRKDGGEDESEVDTIEQYTDTISRQAVIITVDAMRKKCDTDNIDDYRDLLVEAIEVLPNRP